MHISSSFYLLFTYSFIYGMDTSITSPLYTFDKANCYSNQSIIEHNYKKYERILEFSKNELIKMPPVDFNIHTIDPYVQFLCATNSLHRLQSNYCFEFTPMYEIIEKRREIVRKLWTKYETQKKCFRACTTDYSDESLYKSFSELNNLEKDLYKYFNIKVNRVEEFGTLLYNKFGNDNSCFSKDHEKKFKFYKRKHRRTRK